MGRGGACVFRCPPRSQAFPPGQQCPLSVPQCCNVGTALLGWAGQVRPGRTEDLWVRSLGMVCGLSRCSGWIRTTAEKGWVKEAGVGGGQ